ncbi:MULTISPECIES: sugar ABC transporter permease [unclassified Caballeronia]|uniref:sugar ABC transporter permease n=1 Tax=unclassified Caballeronia TaxID=2646786 RepID=UPI002862FB03|nr:MULTISPECIES: sugar ABC transporter permease [unclassified Caballeronia]MDR5740482.1 sugar ABC transporter permease [Caballeronia sp. LZ016]MDR5808997.1 sugar ABC transporter permease [Caballeronia sp. LZ019]
MWKTERVIVALAWMAAVCGVVVQACVFVLAAHGGPPTRVLLTCLSMQAIAAALIAFACWRALPQRYRSKGAWCYLWLLNFAVPAGGALASVGAMAVALALPRRAQARDIAYVEEPEFATHLIPHVSYGRGARLKAELQNAEAVTSLRMTALLAMQSMPAHTISPLLRGMLADPLDDIRLLAYGMLDSQEKQLTQRILAQRPKLAMQLSPRERYEANKTLAELYGELIYAHLVQGDVYRNAADQADAYAAAALDIDPSDAALWRMRGRLALDRGDLDAADNLLERAIEQGFARDRMLPYLAEAAYRRGDFARVKTLLAQMSPSAILPVMKPVLDYWRGSLATLRKGPT